MMESFFKKCEIEVLFENKIVGETMQNNYNIVHQTNRIELLEIISPNLVIENFKGTNFEFACALVHSLRFKHGNIQMVHAKRFKELGAFELVVYYSHSDVIDMERREQIIFYHSQNKLDFEYPNPARLLQFANSYFSKKHPD